MSPWRIQVRCALLVLALGGTGCGEPAAPTAPADPPPVLSAAQATEAERLGVPATMDRNGHRFVLVPPIEFEMGTGRYRHGVRMEVPYYMQTTWVTPAQRRAWRADAPDGPWTHDDARAYAAWLTERDGYFRFRLPTEAEWACAARGQIGIGGMDGRATWCRDWFAPLPDYLVGDPVGPGEGTERVIRGDGARRGALPDAARAAVRLVAEVGYGNQTLGVVPVTFRTVDNAGRPVPGYGLRMISIRDRLVDRALRRPLRWRELGKSPWSMRVVPGRYYVHSYEVKDGRTIWGRESKLDFPGSPSVVDIELPAPDVLLHR